ncbi:BrnT family toxin [Butyrivibrio sp. MC2021]|uniref:BrnT family toxin n=1 Tax=Butyrivibrio sp. MC2021 TaxID=1408306 RepID=UPI001FA75C1D|nr:BrnT family toxin [Butyrivibrio sp. MC2021]
MEVSFEIYVWGMYNMCIEGLYFEWDENKNLINKEKHGVSFEEARTVFYDENALLEFDDLHSGAEDRFRILGRSNNGNILLVVHCIRSESLIRIISSRKATSNEKRGYERSCGL